MGSETPFLTVHAGPHDRHQCPVSFDLPESHRKDDWELIQPHGPALAVQIQADGSGVFILPELSAGETITFRLQSTSEQMPGHLNYVALADTGNALSLTVGGTLLTTYHYSNVPARPYFYPLLTANGREVTRAYPMRHNVAFESQDHPHHRSLWIAFGDVNGTDNWGEEPGHGSTRHDSTDRIQSGDVFGQFATTGTWTTPMGSPLLTQHLRVTAWATPPEFRLLDFDIDLTALEDDVLFGDTKEGGILAVRVVGTMDVPRGGRIENSYGAINEAETWGRSAHWCDYSGPVADRTEGIAIMDHPLSFRYPTHWHVRNYGLMTANPFGYAAYTAGAKRGEHRLGKGETLRFRYRLLIHSGNAQEGRVQARYLDFVSPPVAKLTIPE